MKAQAEGMAEQLRRAVETKCDLVLAQNEMERRHEQGQIVKENEMKDLRVYIQEILESQAQSELNFMNEISSLAKKLEVTETQHRREIEEKDYEISQLESEIKSMRIRSVQGSNSAKAYQKIYGDSSYAYSPRRSNNPAYSPRRSNNLTYSPDQSNNLRTGWMEGRQSE